MIFEKVNPAHPDKVADRIAGALTDLAYSKNPNAIIATEVLLGHGICTIISETNVNISEKDAEDIVSRIGGKQYKVNFVLVPQDEHLAGNQSKEIRCGDNGIFKGVPTDNTELLLANLTELFYKTFGTDGKYIISDNDKCLIVCQSNATEKQILNCIGADKLLFNKIVINPLGFWTGGADVDCGATNRKLGSDMGRCVTGGGLHGKDISKGDVSLNIYAYLKAQELNHPVEIYCAIGDEYVIAEGEKILYSEITKIAKEYIDSIGGFEKFAEYGLIK